MQLSHHFSSEEFEHGAAIPDDCIGIFQKLSLLVLEPIRTFVGEPITITSGYRSSVTNAQAHGASNSEHMATPEFCAADFTFDTTFGKMISVRSVFDWIRENSALPFHQVILEADGRGGSIIHISYHPSKLPSRSALIGATHNATPYSTADIVAYSPSETENVDDGTRNS